MIICVDLDGTLLNNKKEITSNTIYIFNLLHNLGHNICINTARSFNRTITYANLIDADYLICNSGANVYVKEQDKYKIILNDPIEKSKVSIVCEQLLKYCKYFSIQTLDNLYTNEKNPKAEYVIEKSGKFWENEEVFKIVVYKGDKHIIEKIASENNLRYIVYVNGSYGCINNERNDKLTGLLFLLNYINSNLDNVIYFGDDYGDLDCIKKAYIGVAMKNSIPAVLKSSLNICESNNDEGVYKYLNKLHINKII